MTTHSGKKAMAALLLAAGLASASAFGSPGTAPAAGSQQAAPAHSGLYIKVRLWNPVKMSKLQPGSVVEGVLSRDVYSADHKLFSTGSRVRLTVDHMERRRRPRDDHWPWVVQAFTPRHQAYPVFTAATVSGGQGESTLPVSLISVSRLREVEAHARKHASRRASDEDRGAVEVSRAYTRNAPTPTMVLEASEIEGARAPADGTEATSEPGAHSPQTVPAATRCRVLLLGEVSASRNRPGDVVRGRVIEPVLVNSQVVIPAGSLLEGTVLKRTPPRWLSRSGSLYLGFDHLTLPAGTRVAVSASVAGVELDRRSHTRVDAEGQLHGERPGKAWMAINLGVTAGLAKEVDDSVQLVVEAIVSTATDVSTAGTARIAASCVSGLYMATRRGRDVVLPRFSELEISLDHPVILGGGNETSEAPPTASGEP